MSSTWPRSIFKEIRVRRAIRKSRARSLPAILETEDFDRLWIAVADGVPTWDAAYKAAQDYLEGYKVRLTVAGKIWMRPYRYEVGTAGETCSGSIAMFTEEELAYVENSWPEIVRWSVCTSDEGIEPAEQPLACEWWKVDVEHVDEPA